MDKTITIRMPQALLDEWLLRLRSGNVPQAIGRLRCGIGYCCLGVLRAIPGDQFEGSDSEPSLDWLHSQGVHFRSVSGEESRDPYLPALGETAAFSNDNGCGFEEIADMATIHDLSVLRTAKESYGPRVYAELLHHILARQKAGERGIEALNGAFDDKRRERNAAKDGAA
jgi:hypothetical protein